MNSKVYEKCTGFLENIFSAFMQIKLRRAKHFVFYENIRLKIFSIHKKCDNLCVYQSYRTFYGIKSTIKNAIKNDFKYTPISLPRPGPSEILGCQWGTETGVFQLTRKLSHFLCQKVELSHFFYGLKSTIKSTIKK